MYQQSEHNFDMPDEREIPNTRAGLDAYFLERDAMFPQDLHLLVRLWAMDKPDPGHNYLTPENLDDQDEPTPYSDASPSIPDSLITAFYLEILTSTPLLMARRIAQERINEMKRDERLSLPILSTKAYYIFSYLLIQELFSITSISASVASKLPKLTSILNPSSTIKRL
jgi:hypothetical protein